MKVQEAISTLMRRWLLRFWIRNVLIMFLGVACIAPWVHSIWMLLLFGLVIRGLSFFLKDKPNRAKLIAMLNAQFPELEYSAQLVDKEGAKGLAVLQQQRIEKRIDGILASFKYPVKWVFIPFLLLLAAGSIFISRLPQGHEGVMEAEQTPTNPSTENLTPEALLPLRLENLVVTVEAPSYTGLTDYTSAPDLRVPEGSRINWSFDFTSVPEEAFLHFSTGDSMSIIQDKQLISVRRTPEDQGFYWVQYFDGSADQRTPYYKIELIPDEPPVVEIGGIAQYQELPYSTDASLTFSAKALDDYGLTDARIIATVTKGDGESVKFREEHLPFKATVSGKQFTEKMTLSASDFGMEPGNELYFYLEATDNKTPESQSNRTETYFFVLEDTTDVEFSLVGGLGVDLMPEYFRSQRQIIIDTEKLLAEKSQITASAFKARSNALGFDQKTLRIKYGQFLGEEAESGIAIENEIDPDELEDLDRKQNPRKIREEHDHKPGENVLEEFGHNHDHEDEAGQLMDKGTEQKTEAEKAIEEIAHNHDDAETATFYEVSLKTKLRTALSEMWDAELYLRLFEPEKSLAYQYAALKLLKEIKNHARIYVQRIGFDPPPITEDGKRLTGELDDVHAQGFTASPVDSVTFPFIREALTKLGTLTIAKDSVENSYQEVLRLAGNELAGEAIRFPSRYLEELGLISRLIKMETFYREDLADLAHLKKVFLSILGEKEIVPVPVRASSHPLTERVRLNLSNQSSRP